jgi:hypothetical protein
MVELDDDLWGIGNGANFGPSSQTITMPDLGGGASGFGVWFFPP